MVRLGLELGLGLGLGLALGLDWVVHYFLDLQKLRYRYSALVSRSDVDICICSRHIDSRCIEDNTTHVFNCLRMHVVDILRFTSCSRLFRHADKDKQCRCVCCGRWLYCTL